jgi:hypothetical protein
VGVGADAAVGEWLTGALGDALDDAPGVLDVAAPPVHAEAASARKAVARQRERTVGPSKA